MNTPLIDSTYGIDNDLYALEEKLRGFLIPVTPRYGFIQDLHHRLMRRYFFFNLIPKPVQSVLVISGGLIGSFAILLMGFRAVLSLVSVIGILHQQYKKYKRQVKKPQSVSTPTPISN